MKINGKTFTTPPRKDVVIMRGSEPVHFILEAILDYTEFEEVCKLPNPPIRVTPGKGKTPVYDDPNYTKAIHEWSGKRVDWMFLKGVIPTDIEWETVDMADPETWGNYKTEMRKAGFTDAQLGHLLSAITDLNGLDPEKIEKATKDFLATVELRRKAQSSLDSDPSSTQSGEPVSE